MQGANPVGHFKAFSMPSACDTCITTSEVSLRRSVKEGQSFSRLPLFFSSFQARRKFSTSTYSTSPVPFVTSSELVPPRCHRERHRFNRSHHDADSDTRVGAIRREHRRFSSKKLTVPPYRISRQTACRGEWDTFATTN